jgi:glucose-1-phosphate cytidylyltransferase
MKVLILAGGKGTRLAEETDLIPKPMVEIGGKPILWHIMQHYARYGFKEFVLALGYKSEIVKRFLLDYRSATESLTLDMRSGRTELLEDGGNGQPVDWTVHLLETGLETMTGGRLQRALPLLGEGTFMMTYGDGVSDIDLHGLVEFHRSHGRLATVSIVRPTSLYGHMKLDGDFVTEFAEKPQVLDSWINGGFFVLEPGVASYLGGDSMPWEREPLSRLAADGQLAAYRHEGFWQCMDSLRDKRFLESMWDAGSGPWSITT